MSGFSCHNERGELSEGDSLSAAMVAAHEHLVTDGEKAPIVIVDNSGPKAAAVVSWLPAGSQSIPRIAILEEART